MTKTSRTFGRSGPSCRGWAVSVPETLGRGAMLGLLGGLPGVHEEVDIALAVAEFDVLEAVVLVGQREQSLGEKSQPAVTCRVGFAGARDEKVAGDADVIAEIEEFVEGELWVAHVIACGRRSAAAGRPAGELRSRLLPCTRIWP